MGQSITTGISLNGQLIELLMCEDIEPGSDPSYQLCKTIYTYHPLGAKMAEGPITMAQSQPRTIVVQNAPDEVLEAFKAEWENIGADSLIHNVMSLSRVYGIASMVVGCPDVPSDKPLDMKNIWKQQIYFNILDPLNTAGSLVLNQQSTSPDFNKPVTVATSGEKFHRSRYIVMMNEAPIFLQYTTSAFGFVGRSVYQRALFPLKSFVRSMIADDLIQTKLGVFIARQRQPGSIIDNLMAGVAAIKRMLIKEAQTGNVVSIDVEESIETLNMQNVDNAGTYSRDNILKNTATAADMPAKLLMNETMVSGFGEGSEDAKHNALYVDGIRRKAAPSYRWFDNIVQYRSWNPDFYETIQAKYPDEYKKLSYEEAFSQWRKAFKASWPSFMIEEESKQVEVDRVKFEAAVAVLQTLMEKLDPENLMIVMQWLADSISDNERLFEHELSLDFDTLRDFLEDQQKQKENAAKAALEPDPEESTSVAKKVGKFGG